jgi:hypothetical protein
MIMEIGFGAIVHIHSKTLEIQSSSANTSVLCDSLNALGIGRLRRYGALQLQT